MSNKLSVTLLAAVTLSGEHLEKGSNTELPEKSAKALIQEGLAKAFESKKAPGSDSEGGKDKDVQNPSLTPNSTGEDSVETIWKALDHKYVSRIPELKDHAKEADVQFAHDATKAEVIEAVILAGKAEAVLAK